MYLGTHSMFISAFLFYMYMYNPTYYVIFSLWFYFLFQSLGNHEFDDGVEGLTPLIKNLNSPVLAANLVLDKEPRLNNETNLLKSIIYNIGNVSIGVIGYLTPDTKILAIKNNVEYVDEVTAIREEVFKLKQHGVNIFIALGHSGFNKDEQIAREVEDIDLVIGGHTNTFLWNGPYPDVEKPEGPYPTLVKQPSGRLVPVVQAYAYTKYLGNLHLIFDSNGELFNYSGNPILLDKNIPQDPEMLQIIDFYREDVLKISEEILGISTIDLDARSCRLVECNIGNLIADAMIEHYVARYNGTKWTDTSIAIIQGGGIRTSVAHINRPFNVTKGDLLAVMPFGGKMVRVTMSGKIIRKMLEHSLAYYNMLRAGGQFLQYSGIKVIYDLKNKPGSRISKVSVRCSDCDIPRYEALDLKKQYNVLMSTFLAKGGDGFTMFDELPTIVLDYNELDCTIEYVKNFSPIRPELEDRIVLLNYGNKQFLSGTLIILMAVIKVLL